MESTIVLIALAVVAFLIASGMGQAASDSTNQDSGSSPASAPADNTPDPGSTSTASMHITNDPSTWPKGDRVWDVCRAIAYAEGAQTPGSIPDRYNNPGDITDGGQSFSHIPGSLITMFPDKSTGWSWLHSKVFNAASGQSVVYTPDMTWEQIGSIWANHDSNWATNVCNQLGVATTSTLNDYVGFQVVNLS